jgi:hypothetical protein
VSSRKLQLKCWLSSLLGVKFVLITVPAFQLSDAALKSVYEIYAEQLRDPFYAAEMPIRNENFDKRIVGVIKSFG